MGAVEFRITGDLEKFDKFLLLPRFRSNLKREMRKATIKNSLLVILTIGRRIRDEEFEKNAPLTLALSKGTLALLKEKNMLDALSFNLRSSFESEVGFIKSKQSTGGVTGQTIEMQKLVELMHTGYIITVTPKMMAAIIIALRNKKTKKGNLTGKARKALRAIEASEGKPGKRTFRVPPRKFMEETLKDPDLQKLIRQNWRDALERVWKKQGALGGEHRDR